MVAMVPSSGYRKPAPTLARTSRTGTMNPVGAPLSVGIVAQAQMRLRHADRQLVEALAGIALDLLLRFRRILDAAAAIHFRHDDFDLFLDAHLKRIEEFELARLLAGCNHSLSEIHRAQPAFRPMVGHHGVFRARRDRRASAPVRLRRRYRS